MAPEWRRRGIARRLVQARRAPPCPAVLLFTADPCLTQQWLVHTSQPPVCCSCCCCGCPRTQCTTNSLCLLLTSAHFCSPTPCCCPQEVVRTARQERRVASLSLHVDADNTPALALYQGEGFESEALLEVG